MVIELINIRNIADPSIDKVHCYYRYFDEGKLHVRHRCERLRNNESIETKMHI